VNLQSSTPTLRKIPLTFPSEAWNGNNSLAGSFRMVDGANPAQDSNFVLAGVRFYNDRPGFQLANIGWGGKDVDYFINGADQHFDQFVQMTDTNMAYIWIGQNNVLKYDGAQFKSRMQTLIAKYKTARPDMKFVLISTYDTGDARLADYAQSLYEISQIDPATVFLNLYKSAGSYSFLDSNYLADHVHPNAAGNTYFANQTQYLLSLAEAQAVKLPGDANLDGIVDSKDFSMLASYFGQSDTYLATGDFNGDGITNALDFNVLAANYGQTTPAAIVASAMAPEPASAAVALLAVLAGTRRFRRI
jgi:hypothetical protein